MNLDLGFKPMYILFVLIILILIISLILIFTRETFTNEQTKIPMIPDINQIVATLIPKKPLIFKAPMSLTKIKTETKTEPKTSEKSDEFDLVKLLSSIQPDTKTIDGNTLSYPSFFFVNEKWPGSLPRPLYQGTCGSCWGFAAVTALSSRFYIESCGLSGCMNYPQINFGSLNNVYYNLNNIYKFRKIYLTDAFKLLDTSKDDNITLDEWSKNIIKYFDSFNSQGTPYMEKHYIAQVLVYMLNFQSLGSIDLTNRNEVEQRINDSFESWLQVLKSNNKTINITDLKNFWDNEPITLSAEKIIACCNDCVKEDMTTITGSRKPDVTEPLVCLGSTLDEAWTMLRESGTPTAMCIGYNLDSWKPGSHAPTCGEVQGPIYSFCSGYTIDRSHFNIGDRGEDKGVEWAKDINQTINKFEESNVNPIAIPHVDQNLPWIDPQLFRFRAKNVYKVKNDVKHIQREILERGPVTTGFLMYPDFQFTFGTDGLGGQFFKDSTDFPLGSTKNSLIYKWSGDKSISPIGGHAVTIVGWGTYKYVDKKAPNNNGDNTYYIPYWICLNSWGSKWGTSGFSKYENRGGVPEDLKGGGYFWILRGTNECEIENNVIVGQPDIENISYPDVVQRYGWGLPPPSTESVEYIKQRTETINLGNNNYLEYDPANKGGGSFTTRNERKDERGEIEYIWKVTSMNPPPSPYTLFWNSSRPIYCLGEIQKDLTELTLDDIIVLDPKDYETLKILTKKHQKNPLLVLGSEQLQLLNFIPNGKSIQVYRAVNNSLIQRHDVNEVLKVIPFKELTIDILDKYLKRCDSTQVDVE